MCVVARRHLRAAVRAFTLIELLVVVSIIAMLIAILLPSLKEAREQGKATVCAAHLRQLGLGVRMYADENRGAMVKGIHTALGEKKWLTLLEQYVIKEELVRCPTDRSQTWEPEPFAPALGYRVTSFVTNELMVSKDDGVTRIEQVRNPSGKIFVAELRDNVTDDTFFNDDHFHPRSWEFYVSTPQDELAIERHNGRANYWFVDGHVERLVFERTWNIDGTVNMYDPKK